MTRALRQRHRRIVQVLLVVLPVAFAVGIAARRPVPELDSLPAELVTSFTQLSGGGWQATNIFTNTPVHVYLLRGKSSERRPAIALSAEADFAKPDLLAYWIPAKPGTPGKLPDEAVLLGSFGSSTLPLPDLATKTNGSILLYSLANQEIVDVSRPVKFDY